jgi:hypothetical protein
MRRDINTLRLYNYAYSDAAVFVQYSKRSSTNNWNIHNSIGEKKSTADLSPINMSRTHPAWPARFVTDVRSDRILYPVSCLSADTSRTKAEVSTEADVCELAMPYLTDQRYIGRSFQASSLRQLLDRIILTSLFATMTWGITDISSFSVWI